MAEVSFGKITTAEEASAAATAIFTKACDVADRVLGLPDGPERDALVTEHDALTERHLALLMMARILSRSGLGLFVDMRRDG